MPTVSGELPPRHGIRACTLRVPLPTQVGAGQSADACTGEPVNGTDQNPLKTSQNEPQLTTNHAETGATGTYRSTPQGGRSRSWRKLSTVDDVRLFLRQLILQTKAAGPLDTKKAAVLGQLALYLLKTIEVGELEERILRLEAEQDGHGNDRTIHIRVGGPHDETA